MALYHIQYSICTCVPWSFINTMMDKNVKHLFLTYKDF